MLTRRGFIWIAILTASLAAFITSTSLSAGAGRRQATYLAAGDSVTFGKEATNPARTGYVPQLAAHLAADLTPGNAPSMPEAAAAAYVRTANIARLEDETSTDMVAPGGQLAEAEAILRQHNQNSSTMDDVKVVTFTIGANDFRALFIDPRCSPVPTQACTAAVSQTLATVQANLHEIMGTLREAAGPDTVIATMTYYNPFVGGCAIAGPLGSLIPVVLGALNNTIATTAPGYDILVAPVHAAGLGTADFFGDCIHPNDSGYTKIAQAFKGVIDPALP